METDKLQEEIAFLKRQLERERAERQQAEKLLQSTSRDLKESNRELKQLNESLEKNILRRTSTLTSLIKNLHAGILLEDENRRIILINEKFCEIFHLEYNPEILIGQDCSESAGFTKFLFEDPEGYLASVAECVATRKIRINEVFKMSDGRVLERDFLPINSGAEHMGHMWQYRDITEQYHFEEKIRQSEEKYRGIIENMELGLLEVDSDYHIIRAYSRFCDMTGYTEEELIGKEAIHLFLPEEYDALISRRDERGSNGAQNIYEARIRRKDGEIIWVLIGESPFYDNAGNFSGTIGIHYNITDRKLLERELREAREIAERSRDAEKQFLANMSHEIRNPINAIAGLINLLYDTKLSEEQCDYLNNIKYAADILLDLISGILDLSKIESGKMEVEEKTVKISEIIRAIVQTYSFKTSDMDLRFSSEIDPRLSQPVIAAPTIINQILLNLIGNAVKFTESGEINIRAVITKETVNSIEMETTISDTGIGITRDQQERIFDNFQQADQQIKLKYGGTGLGLAIVKQLLTFYDGSIHVVSKAGEGSAFTFFLKLKKAGEEGTREEDKNLKELSTSKIKHILIVEDNKFNQQYLIGLLKKWDIHFDLANNGEEALELIDKNIYDLVLMDIRMPVMDGYETTIRIRNAEHNPNKNITIIALTASALVDEKERALAAGMNYHLTKPFSPNQLLNILDQANAKSIESKTGGFLYSAKLDQEYLQRFYEDDLDRAALMFQIFLKNIDKEIENLKCFYLEKDWKKLASLAHKIKPNFAMVGLTECTEKMQELELFAKEEKLSQLEEIVPNFIGDFKNKRKLVEEELISINNFKKNPGKYNH